MQVLLNMLEFGMDPQTALDSLRFCVGPGHEGAGGGIALEHGLPEAVVQRLRALGHEVEVLQGHDRARFGRGQIIQQLERRDRQGVARRVFMAGSDPRADGCAVGLTR